MPLYQVPQDRHVSTVETSKGYVAKFLGQPKPKIKAVCRIIDEGLNRLRPSQNSRLVWTRLASFAGDHSNALNHADNEYLWKTMKEIFGEDHCKIALGGLLRWRISTRDETWLLYVRDTGEHDPVTDKLITISEYWIDETYKTKSRKFDGTRRNRNAAPTAADILNLKGAWGLK